MEKKESTIYFNQQFGQRVKALRENLHLTRKELAERLDISDYFMVEIESGRKGTSNITLCNIAEVLCTTIDYLLTGREKFSDVSTVTAMLRTIDEPLVQGAEELLKTYIATVSFVKAKIIQKEIVDARGDESDG